MHGIAAGNDNGSHNRPRVDRDLDLGIIDHEVVGFRSRSVIGQEFNGHDTVAL
jgi:hypothetical protein